MSLPFPRWRSVLVCSLFLALFGWQPCALAEDDSYACLRGGAWKGHIGNAPVTLSFEVAGVSELTGSSADQPIAPIGRYYYRDQWQDLLLVPDSRHSLRWNEVDPAGRVTGYWTLNCHARTLSGVWTSTDHKRSAPIEADIALDEEYMTAKVTPITPVVVPQRRMQDSRYELIAFPKLKSFYTIRLKGDSLGIRKINDNLWTDLLTNFREAMKCTVANQGYKVMKAGELFNYDVYNDVVALNRKYLVVSLGTQFLCPGNPHPYSDSRVSVFDLESGKAEQMKTWFALTYQDAPTKTGALGRLVRTQYDKQRGDVEDANECFNNVDYNVGWTYPSAAGMNFVVAADWYGASNCNEHVTIPFDQIRPFLSDAGRQKIGYFRSK